LFAKITNTQNDAAKSARAQEAKLVAQKRFSSYF